ncbi:hypothetical protein GQ54DRAFT_322526 [Martensiomyces pterosporus]|nr:hypothetical protein GQ54DRAFT_322526 [Martensiomyces pterosporus]
MLVQIKMRQETAPTAAPAATPRRMAIANKNTASFTTAPFATPLTPCRATVIYEPLAREMPDPEAAHAVNMGTKRNRLPEGLPTFNKGLDSDVDDPVDFVIDIENLVVSSVMDIDVRGPSAMVSRVNCALGRLILEKCNGRNPATWAIACELFLELYPPSMTKGHAREKLRRLRMDVYKPFYVFTYEFDKLCRTAGLDEHDQEPFDHFLRALPKELRDMTFGFISVNFTANEPVSRLYEFINHAW